MDPKQLRRIIREEVTGTVKNVIPTIVKNIVRAELKPIDKRLKRVEDKVDALSGDVEKLHDDVKGIRDTEGMYHSRNKREIDEIKKHLDLPLMPDAPNI